MLSVDGTKSVYAEIFPKMLGVPFVPPLAVKKADIRGTGF